MLSSHHIAHMQEQAIDGYDPADHAANVIPSSEAATFHDAGQTVNHLKAEAGYLLYCLRRLDMNDGDCLVITQALERIEERLHVVGREVPAPAVDDSDVPF